MEIGIDGNGSLSPHDAFGLIIEELDEMLSGSSLEAAAGLLSSALPGEGGRNRSSEKDEFLEEHFR